MYQYILFICNIYKSCYIIIDIRINVVHPVQNALKCDKL